MDHLQIASSTVQLASATDSVRIFLHVTAATIWVGGQFTLAALVPVLRKATGNNSEIIKAVAKGFNRIAWPAFAVLIATGIWNMTSIPKDAPSNYSMVLGMKMMIVLLSGLAAFMHSRSKNPKSVAMWGSISGLAALAATYFGALLAG
jgi:putative copper export protein